MPPNKGSKVKLSNLRGPLHETDMKLTSFMPARVSISSAGLSYCCACMMSGRHEI